MNFDLDRLGWREFEHLTQALALRFVGRSVQPFGDGPDGGREASFEGECTPPLVGSAPWAGYGVLQAKFRVDPPASREENASWLKSQLRSELKEWSNPAKNRVTKGRLPEYLIVATNVKLSGSPGTGGKDVIERVLRDHAAVVPLKGWDLWDYDKICRLLDTAPRRIAERWAHLITPGDVLARVLEQLNPPFAEVMAGQLAKDLLAEQWVRLTEAGAPDNRKLTLGQIVTDVPARYEDRGVMAVTQLLELAHPSRTAGVVVRGGPGQGKSTLSQLLCQLHRAALLMDHPAQAIGPQAATLRDVFVSQLNTIGLSLPRSRRWPAHVRLHAYSDALVKEPHLSLLQYLATTTIRDPGSRLTKQDMSNWLGSWPWLLVLDGLDEVAHPDSRDLLLSRLSDFQVDAAAAGANVFTVVTTRDQGYSPVEPLDGLPELHLRPFSVTQAVRLAERLAHARHPGDDSHVEILVRRAEQAAEHAVTGRLMHSALQVTILSLLLEQRPEPLSDRYSLFSAYYDVVIRREAAKGTPDARALSESEAHVGVLHRRAGLTLQVRSERAGEAGATFTMAELRALALRRLQEEEYPDEDAQQLAKEIIRLATTRLPFLDGAADRYGFAVRSIQEFMAARALAARDGALDSVMDRPDLSDRLLPLIPSDHWRHTWRLVAAELFHREESRDELLALMAEADTHSPLAARVRPGARLALDLLEDGIAEVSPRFRKRLAIRALDLLPLPPDRSVLRLARVLLPVAEIAHRVIDQASLGSIEGLTATVVLAQWASERGEVAATARERLRELTDNSTSTRRAVAVSLAAHYPYPALRPLLSLASVTLPGTTLAEELEHLMSQGLPVELRGPLHAVKIRKERRDGVAILMVDRSNMPDLAGLSEILSSEGTLEVLLQAAEVIKPSTWPLRALIYQMFGEWLQRRPVGDQLGLR
ncbi:NACHT domain-containing protein [Nonomuraea sp. NPDC059007]|uniref:NACHT domain-containing protein n=1 Tax=Nonomuraea sp. NPDC059007 TaxID=3346692 RepID=UPI0036B8D54A